LVLLSKTEKAYLAEREQLSKHQQRDIPYGLNKKLRVLIQELAENSCNSGTHI
jgi:hypothetical protein